jgi:hypothetical protein
MVNARAHLSSKGCPKCVRNLPEDGSTVTYWKEKLYDFERNNPHVKIIWPDIDIYKGSYTDTSVEFTRYTYEVRYFGYALTNICGDEDYYQSLHLYSDRTDERGYKENKGNYKNIVFFVIM